jgi:putative ABC transport system permease protein
VRASLRAQADRRLGRVEQAVQSGDRYFRAGLPEEAAAQAGGSAAAAISLRGSVSAAGGARQATGVQVLGVDDSFWSFAASPPTARPSFAGVLVNRELAARLGVAAGEQVVVRIAAVSGMASDAPLSGSTAAPIVLRLEIAGITGPESLGEFSLAIAGSVPPTLFMDRETLATRLGRPGRANTALFAGTPGPAISAALAASFTLADAGLSVRPAGTGSELVSDRVFIPAAAQAAAQAAANGAAETGRGILTYFVDLISAGSRSVSYSFVSSAGPGRVPADLADDEVVLNAWAARELQAGLGSRIEMSFSVPADDPAGGLVPRRAAFTVRSVTPITDDDRSLMPDFPGFVGVRDCRAWDPGVPLDLSRITARDQDYWEQWAGSPRAFVTLAAAQRMWANRFGAVTAVRLPSADLRAVAAAIEARLAPSDFGITLSPVRELGQEASQHGVDFGSLFVGLSFFLVAAALLLVFLLALLAVQHRGREIRTLRALGLTRGRIASLFVAEGAAAAAAGALAGMPLGFAFLRLVVTGLAGAWKDAVAATALVPVIGGASMAMGAAAGFAASLLVVAAAALRVTRDRAPAQGRRRASRARRGMAAALAAGGAACAAASLAFLPSPTSYLAAGGAVLVLSVGLAGLAAGGVGTRAARGVPSLGGLAAAAAVRRRSRSLAVMALFACGVFLVAAVGANRPAVTDPGLRSSGTGGFDLVSDTTLPVPHERLARVAGSLPHGSDLAGLRVLPGDDASCLSLARAAHPRLVGIPRGAFRGRFAFTGTASRLPDPWALLDGVPGGAVIPAVADETVITWTLGMKIGDEIPYTAEDGTPLRVRLVAGLAVSVFQGALLVAEDALARYFPSVSGASLLLVDSPTAQAGTARSVLDAALASVGPATEEAALRLARFQGVEVTYLAIFGFLGWLGMLLGAAGLGVVVLRNIEEERGELAVLRAVGIPRGAILRLLLVENLLPVAAGLLAGAAAAVVAVGPGAATGAVNLVPLAGQVALLAAAAAVSVTACALALPAHRLIAQLRVE